MGGLPGAPLAVSTPESLPLCARMTHLRLREVNRLSRCKRKQSLRQGVAAVAAQPYLASVGILIPLTLLHGKGVLLI
jgi:hypothetical protein